MKPSAAIVACALGCPLAAVAPWHAAAQTPIGVGSGPSQPPPLPDVSPSVEHLLGNAGGVRSRLESHGIYLLLDGTTEFMGNVSGGVKQGATFANQIGLQNDIDWQRLAGIGGLSTHLIMVSRSGSSDSQLFGDTFLPVQEIYGSGGNVVVHLVSLNAEESLAGGRIDIAGGRMNVENDFATSPLNCTFVNNALCGDPKALPGGDIGHSAYPDAVWAGRIRVKPTPDTYVATGVYEVSQGLYTNQLYRSGFKFDASQDSGVYVPLELAYQPHIGPAKLPGHYKIGFGYDSSSTYKSFANALNTSQNASTGPTISTRTGNTQTWVLADQMLVRQGSGENDGLIALGGFVHNDPNNSPYAEQYFVGLVDRGFWRARPADTAGLLFTYNTVSGVLGKVQTAEAEFGIPFSNSATGPQTHEMVVEATYNIRVVPGLNVQPDFQYVFRPNAQANIHDAAVFGFKAHVEF